MRIGIIQGTTQVSKNELLHNTVVKAVEKKGMMYLISEFIPTRNSHIHTQKSPF